MKKELSVKTIVAIGIGSAVFVILGRFAVIPIYTNTNLETSYPFLALMSVVYGPVSGALIGLIGHTLKDFTTYGSAWWSWIVCSGIIGLIYGFAGRKINLRQGVFDKKDMITFNVYQVIGNAIVWGLIAPTLDVLIYSEPVNKVYTQGLISASLNIVAVGIIGTLLMKAYAATQIKQGSLKKD